MDARRRRPFAIPDPRPRSRLDASLPLINVVFVILIFLLMMGGVRQPMPDGIAVARSTDAERSAETAGGIVIDAAGNLHHAGEPVTLDELPARLRAAAELSGSGLPAEVTVIADRRVSSDRFLALAGVLSENGIDAVSVVTTRD